MLKPLKLTAFLLVLFSTNIFAQITTPPPPDDEELVPPEPEFTFEKPKSAFQEKLHYGGNVWLGFFGAFYIDVSPMAGIEITEAGTIAGLGATFIYQGGFNQGGTVAVGPRLFVRQPVWRTVFAHAEYELVNADASRFYDSPANTTIGDRGRKWGGAPLIGAGFYQNRSRQQKGSFISIMYNIGQSYGKGFVSPQGLGGNNSPWLLRIGYFF